MTPDEKIRHWFERLKQDDARTAPSFSSSWRSAESRVKRPGSVRFRLAAIAAVIVLAAAGAWIVLKQRPARPIATVAQLSQWRAPTDFLLETPGSQLLRTIPRFGGPPVSGSAEKREEHK